MGESAPMRKRRVPRGTPVQYADATVWLSNVAYADGSPADNSGRCGKLFASIGQ